MIRPYQKGNLVCRLILFDRSYPLARPRLNKSTHVYQPLSNQSGIISELGRYDSINVNEPMLIDVSFFFKRYGKEDFPIPNGIGDLDNHVKGLLDNLQRTQIIANDRYVVGLHAEKAWSTEDYVEIEIYGVMRNELLQHKNA